MMLDMSAYTAIDDWRISAVKSFPRARLKVATRASPTTGKCSFRTLQETQQAKKQRDQKVKEAKKVVKKQNQGSSEKQQTK